MAKDASDAEAELCFGGEISKEAKDRIKKDQEFVKKLEEDYTGVKFRWGRKRFSYRLINGVPTVFLGQPCDNFGLLALHELGHALCKHKDYKIDVERIKIESAAWETAKTVLLKYYGRAFRCDNLLKDEILMGEFSGEEGVKDSELAKILPKWDEDFVQEKLDTYRDWLHAKSKCKKCGLTGYQTKDGKYHCPRCEAFILS